MARKKYYKKEKEVVNIKKLNVNYELRYNFIKKLSEFIKTFPKEHRNIKIESVIGLDGCARDQWVRVIRDVQMGAVMSFLLDNGIQFKFDNVAEADLNILRAEYLTRQKRLAEIVRLKGEQLDVSDEDYSFMNIEPFEYQKKAIKFFEINNGKAILGDEPGVGKEMPLDTPISTPNGWVKMGDISVGNEVHNRFGGISNVTGVFPQGKKDVYRIHFNDGTSTKCGLEHLWVVRDFNRRKKGAGWIVKSLKKLMSAGLHHNFNKNRASSGKKPILKWEIPVTRPVFYKEKNYFIEPYLLGSLLGDRYICEKSCTGISIPYFQLGIKEKVNNVLSEGHKLTKYDTITCPQHMVVKEKSVKTLSNKIIQELIRLKVNIKSGDKFIPEIYLRGSVKQRTELLKGLMDTNGSIHKNKVHFHSTSKKLSEGVVLLVQSLGGIAKINVHERAKKNKPTKYKVSVKMPFCPFNLSEKAENWSPKKLNYISKYISEVEHIGNEEQQCITVDSPDHTYITENYIVTHNSLSAFAYATKHNLKTLIICPASLKLNWKNEIMKFTGKKSFIYKYKPKKRSDNIAYTKEESSFHITNFESLDTFIKLEYSHKCNGRFLGKPCTFAQTDLIKKYKECPECETKGSVKTRQKGIQFFSDKDGAYLDPEDYDLIIIDECHKMKEAKTKWTQIIKLAFRDVIPRKLLLSGTVIKNRPMEMFVPLNFLDKDQWNNSHQFGVRYCAAVEDNFGWDYKGASHLEELFERVSPYFLRRLKSDVLSELPPKTYMEVPVELSDADFRKYMKLEKEMREIVLEDGTTEEQEEGFLAKVHKLKQFTGMLKIKAVKEMVQDVIDSGEKIVIMSDYQAMAEDLFEHFGEQAVIHTGSMGLDDKESSVYRFQNDKKIKVFCGMIGASGVGITLTKASKLIKLGFSWTPADEIQCEDRIHRASTKADNVLIVTFVCVDTIDEDIQELLKDKAQIASKVMDNKNYSKEVHKIRNSGDSILGQLMERMKNKN